MSGLGSQLAARLWPEESAGLRDPAGWIERRFAEHLWSAQREIVDSVIEHRHTAVQSAHGIGKSYTAARIVALWLSVHSAGEAFALTTAPTGDQINAILWRELDQAHHRGRLAGKITGTSGTRWWHMHDQLVALGRKSQDFIDADRAAAAFQGIHAQHLLVVLDEASGIQPWLWDAVDALTTNEAARVLAIGNPLDPSSPFAKVCAPGSGWHRIKVSVFDTPAFTGERVPPELLRRLPSRRWVEERRERWGEQSPLYVARVLGEFPEQSDDGLLSPALIREAQERDLSERAHLQWPVFGVDVARTGADATVIYRNHGGRARLDHEARGHDLMRTVGEVARRLRHDFDLAVIDAPGLGYGVYDRLREQGRNVRAFVGSARAHDPDRFANRRAELYWRLREAFEAGEVDIDPADDVLAAQLLSIRWFVNSRGQRQIESKDDMRRRGLPSPDRADAICLAVASEGGAVAGISPAPAPVGSGVPSWDQLARGVTTEQWASRRRADELRAGGVMGERY